ncbi:MAG: gamma-glutamyltransferase [Polyangiaceae bacterium]|nr:gamma-glutamyltransferase [Polyangiaceae bacterium]
MRPERPALYIPPSVIFRSKLHLPAVYTFAAALAFTAACETPVATPPPQPTTHVSASATAPSAGASASATAPVPSASASASAEDLYPPPPAPNPPIEIASGGKNAVRSDSGLVTTVEDNATRVGSDVLKKGGNAIDAAVAVAYALAVTHPSAGNLGGGGFMIIRLKSGEVHAVDMREIAPDGVTTEKVLKEIADGADGYTSAAVPGTVAGLSLALEKFGTKPLAELIAPSIELAKSHKLGARQALALSWAWKRLKRDPLARAIWGKGDKPLEQGARVKQPDLAKTLALLSKEGPKAFYEGAIADAIDAAMQKNGGYVRKSDLKAYTAKLRTPLRFSYRGFTVDTMPPPSMGGVAFAEIMLTLERLHAEKAAVNSGESLHYFVEAARRAYVDRRRVGADPEYQTTDLLAQLKGYLSGTHLETRKPTIDRDKATPSADIANNVGADAKESPQTTHFSVVDREGNAVSFTTTLSAGFGSKVVIPGTGLILANSLGAFSEKGVNTVSKGKRPASSMSPAIVTQNGQLRIVLGSPGGDTIPNTVAQVFRNIVDYGMTVDQAVAAPRIHHQYLPDEVRVEKLNAPPKEALADLEKRGHKVVQNHIPLGHAMVIVVDKDGIAWGYADTREGGKAEGPTSEKPTKKASKKGAK